jgi:phosphoribosylformylglycinamidine synthase
MTQTHLPVYRFVVRPRTPGDPRSTGTLSDAQALGMQQVTAIQCTDLYFIEGQLDEMQLHRLAFELLCDPLTQQAEWRALHLMADPDQSHASQGAHLVEVALRPGVTDPVAEQIVRAAHVLGLNGVRRASTGWQFWIEGQNLTADALHLLARRLLSNPVIQRYALGEIEPAFPEPAEASGQVEMIPIRAMTAEQLLACSAQRRAALDLNEMQAIQRYFQSENRDCSDVELECIAQTWSEHCVHKTFKALVTIEASEDPIAYSVLRIEENAQKGASPDSAIPSASTDPEQPKPSLDSSIRNTQYAIRPPINNLLKTYLASATREINAPWVISAFTDNAGILDFDDEYEVSFKVETHNHPSAIEPFGGANTGVGGVIRDVIGVSAKPIANTDVLCFGPQDLALEQLPEGVLHPRRIQSGVVSGVQDYGNKMGIPTVNGAIWYDPGFTANPLVFCGCVGLAPKGKHVRSPQPGDRVIVLGGRTGRDGLRGATFSSQTMDAQTGEVAGASVQIGDPITEKITLEVILRARDEGLYTAITDCGAGGLSSAVGEMTSEIGGDVDLAQVQLKYPGLAPWEIWLSEAQERMVIAVPPQFLPRVQEICDLFEVDLTDIGAFNTSGRLIVRYNGAPVLDLANNFLHNGLPQRHLKATAPVSQENLTDYQEKEIHRKDAKDAKKEKEEKEFLLSQTLLDLLGHPNIASKAATIRIYDHEVQGGTYIKPLTGIENDGPSDAAVLKPIGTRGTTGIVLSNGLNPEYGKRDAYRMAISAIDEAVRNAVAVGANPERIAILDNFCWGNPLRPEVMWSLIEACRGCHDGALAYGTPFVSGKDSLNNEYLGQNGQRESIPPTLLISAIGHMADTGKAVTLDLKAAGDPVYLIGEFQPTFGGSHFALLSGQPSNQPVPAPSELAPRVYQALHQAILSGWVRAAHDLSEGGLGVAAAEMSIAGRLGLGLELPGLDPLAALFGETNGCLLVEVNPHHAAQFAQHFAGLPCLPLGKVTLDGQLSIFHRQTALFSLPVNKLVQAWIK